ncbi:Fasciclin-like arabinogalactan protein 14 [Linum perenne]
MGICFSIAECAAPYNITRVLENYPEYSEFNDLLSRSKLAEYINSKEKVITVLVTKEVGAISGKPLTTMQAILSLHVVLDYLDKTKLKNMKRSVTFTTMFQETGIAIGNQGYLNFTKTGDNYEQIMIGNGRRDSKLSVEIEKLVMTKSPVLSILGVSGLIQAPWVDNIKAPPPRFRRNKKMAPTPSPTNAPSPSRRRRHRIAAPPSEAESPPMPDDDYVDADADADAASPSPAKNSASSSSSVAASLFIGLMASLMLN